MLADRFLGRLPSASAAPRGSPQGRGHLLSPLPALPRWMAGRCCLPLPSICWGLCHDHSRTESLLWGCRGVAAAQALSSACILNPGNPPALAPLWPRDPISQVPLVALRLGTSPLAGCRATGARRSLPGAGTVPPWLPHTPSSRCLGGAGPPCWGGDSQTRPPRSGCKGTVAPAGWAMPCCALSSCLAPTAGIPAVPSRLCHPGCPAACVPPALLLPGPGGLSPTWGCRQHVGHRGTMPDLPRHCRLRFAGSEPAGRGASLRLQHPCCPGPGRGWLRAAAPRDPPTGDRVSLPLAYAGVALATPVVQGCWGLFCAWPASPCPCM